MDKPVPLEHDLLDDFVLIEPSNQMLASWLREALEEKEVADHALDQAPIGSQQEMTWWQAFRSKLGAIPQGIGYLGQAIGLLSRSRWYLETTLSVILNEEESKLTQQEKDTFKAVRARVHEIIGDFEIRLAQIQGIVDETKRQNELDALPGEFLSKIQFIQYLQQPSVDFGALSYKAHLLLLLTFLKDVRIKEQEPGVLNLLFATWASFITNFTAELLNTQRVIVNGQPTDRNPYRNTDAFVAQRPRGAISPIEQNIFLPARRKKNIEAQRALFKNLILQKQINVATVNNQTGLKIGLMMSGGGYRAMALASGYLEALEQVGILDAASHLSALSGSTWFVSAWLQSGLSVTNFNKDLAQRIPYMQVDHLALRAFDDPTRKEALHYEIMFPKFAFNQPIGSVDMFGWLLSQAVLQGNYTTGISNQWDVVKQGAYPFPLYTTISMHNTGSEENPRYRYNWYEVNPLEFENIERGLAIPVWSLGREFENGKSVRTKGLPTYPFEQSFGYMLATFGSAYTIDFLKEGSLFVKGFYGTLLNVLQKIKPVKRLWPAQSINPWRDLAGQPDWIRNKPLLTFVDAGIDFNLPIPPLLKSERDLDVIIMGDSSSGIRNYIQINDYYFPAEFGKFLLYMHDQKFDPLINVYQVDDLLYEPFETYSRPPFLAFKPKERNGLPWLIYVNYVKDDVLVAAALQSNDSQLQQLARKIEQFDPIECEQTGFCGTFNFKYTSEQYEQLKSMGQFNILAHKDRLIKVLEREFVLKSHAVDCSSCLVMAAFKGSLPTVGLYLAKGIDVNTLAEGVPGPFSDDAISALHAAALEGNIEMVRYLLEHTADINQKSTQGMVPLDAAVLRGNEDVVRYLVENNAQIAETTLQLAQRVPVLNALLQAERARRALPEALGQLRKRLERVHDQLLVRPAVSGLSTEASIVKQKD